MLNYGDIEDLTIDNLNNVNIITPLNNQVILYNSTTTNYENKNLILEYNDNISITNPQNNDILQYNNITSNWENKVLNIPTINSIYDITDVVENGTTIDKQYISYIGGSNVYENKTLDINDDTTNTNITYTDNHKIKIVGNQLTNIEDTLANINDVDFSIPPTDGQILQYENASSSWKPVTSSAGAPITLNKLYRKLSSNSTPIGQPYQFGTTSGGDIAHNAGIFTLSPGEYEVEVQVDATIYNGQVALYIDNSQEFILA